MSNIYFLNVFFPDSYQKGHFYYFWIFFQNLRQRRLVRQYPLLSMHRRNLHRINNFSFVWLMIFVFIKTIASLMPLISFSSKSNVFWALLVLAYCLVDISVELDRLFRMQFSRNPLCSRGLYICSFKKKRIIKFK